MSKALGIILLGIWTYLTTGFIVGFAEPSQVSSAIMAGTLALMALVGLIKND